MRQRDQLASRMFFRRPAFVGINMRIIAAQHCVIRPVQRLQPEHVCAGSVEREKHVDVRSRNVLQISRRPIACTGRRRMPRRAPGWRGHRFEHLGMHSGIVVAGKTAGRFTKLQAYRNNVAEWLKPSSRRTRSSTKESFAVVSFVILRVLRSRLWNRRPSELACSIPPNYNAFPDFARSPREPDVLRRICSLFFSRPRRSPIRRAENCALSRFHPPPALDAAGFPARHAEGRRPAQPSQRRCLRRRSHRLRGLRQFLH